MADSTNFTYGDDLSISQNFLHDAHLVEQLVKESNIKFGDTVLEIGPGKGIITKNLARKVGTKGCVYAVEADKKLFALLEGEFIKYKQVKLFNEYIQDFNLGSMRKGYKVFSNIPFTITSQIFRMLLQGDNPPSEGYIIMQDEASLMWGGRALGAEGESMKSLQIFPFYHLEISHDFSRSDFRPVPDVAVVMLHFTQKENSIDREKYLKWIELVSRDRVGEGIWKRLFREATLSKSNFYKGLTQGVGISQQDAQSLLDLYLKLHPARVSSTEVAE